MHSCVFDVILLLLAEGAMMKWTKKAGYWWLRRENGVEVLARIEPTTTVLDYSFCGFTPNGRLYWGRELKGLKAEIEKAVA